MSESSGPQTLSSPGAARIGSTGKVGIISDVKSGRVFVFAPCVL
jgi:hypothetical protein